MVALDEQIDQICGHPIEVINRRISELLHKKQEVRHVSVVCVGMKKDRTDASRVWSCVGGARRSHYP